MTKIEIISFAASCELNKRPDAELLLTKPFGQWDVKVIKFSSRKALEEFNKKANLFSVIKTVVPKGCILYKHQTEEK